MSAWWEDVRAAWLVWRALRRHRGVPVHVHIKTASRTQT